MPSKGLIADISFFLFFFLFESPFGWVKESFSTFYCLMRLESSRSMNSLSEVLLQSDCGGFYTILRSMMSTGDRESFFTGGGVTEVFFGALKRSDTKNTMQ